MSELTHRNDVGISYRGRSIHAAPGVHEHVATMVSRKFDQNQTRIIEVGAGSGALGLRLADLDFDVTQTDLEPAHPSIAVMDLHKPESWDPSFSGGFELVVCVETIEHLENPRAALRAMRNLLVPGGKILVSTPNVNHPHSRLKNMIKGDTILFDSDAYYFTGHITPIPEWLLVEHLKSSGFSDVEVDRAGDMPFRTRRRRVLHSAEMRALRVLRMGQEMVGDGICIFVTATRDDSARTQSSTL